MTTPRETVVRMPEVGDPAPDFKLPAYPEGTISLEDFSGKSNIILAFYPKDDTPGCTREMCSFTEDLSRFADRQTQVLGISCDSVESHRKFSEKHNLKQPLLADEEGKVGRAYGVLGEGKTTANRVLFVIDKQGIVRGVIEGMPSNSEVLTLLDGIK